MNPSFEVFIEDCVRPFHVGLTKEERARPQPLRFNVTARINAPHPPQQLNESIDYYQIILAIEALSASPHVLLETLAKDLAAACFALPHCAFISIEIAKTGLLASTTLGVRYAAARH
jgi:dihydroneopterin aldolase